MKWKNVVDDVYQFENQQIWSFRCICAHFHLLTLFVIQRISKLNIRWVHALKFKLLEFSNSLIALVSFWVYIFVLLFHLVLLYFKTDLSHFFVCDGEKVRFFHLSANIQKKQAAYKHILPMCEKGGFHWHMFYKRKVCALPSWLMFTIHTDTHVQSSIFRIVCIHIVCEIKKMNRTEQKRYYWYLKWKHSNWVQWNRLRIAEMLDSLAWFCF